jgi:hypothetical protein
MSMKKNTNGVNASTVLELINCARDMAISCVNDSAWNSTEKDLFPWLSGQEKTKMLEHISALENEASKGNTESQFKLGLLYAEGVHGFPNVVSKKSLEWLETAADKGHKDAVNALMFLVYPNLIELQPRHTLKRIRNFSKKRNPKAMLEMGKLQVGSDSVYLEEYTKLYGHLLDFDLMLEGVILIAKAIDANEKSDVNYFAINDFYSAFKAFHGC